jgi:hypothetical protein
MPVGPLVARAASGAGELDAPEDHRQFRRRNAQVSRVATRERERAAFQPTQVEGIPVALPGQDLLAESRSRSLLMIDVWVKCIWMKCGTARGCVERESSRPNRLRITIKDLTVTRHGSPSYIGAAANSEFEPSGQKPNASHSKTKNAHKTLATSRTARKPAGFRLLWLGTSTRKKNP